jgi:hypothetical protein
MADHRKLERTSIPGVYRRHVNGCKHTGRCRCPYVVTWRERGRAHKQFFAKFDLAREFKAQLDSGVRTRRPLSSRARAHIPRT